MNAHQQRIIEVKAEIDRLMKWDTDKYGNEVRIPKPGKKREVEILELRLRQAAEANAAYGRAVSLLR